MKKKRVLDIEIEKLRLGELDEKETQGLLDRLIASEGHTGRLEQFIAEEEAFFERNEPAVFSAQVAARLKREARQIQMQKEKEKKRKRNMVIGQNAGIGLGVVALLLVGFNTYSLFDETPNENQNIAQLSLEQNKTIEKSQAERRKQPSLSSDFNALREVKLGENNEVLDGRWLRMFQDFYERYEPAQSPDQVLLTYGNYATYLESGKDKSWADKSAPSAIEIRKRIVEYYDGMGGFTRQNLSESNAEIAKSLFKVSEDEFTKMTKNRISSSDEDELKKSLLAKQKHLSSMENRLESLMEMNIPKWSVAAHYLLASGYVDSADTIRRSYIPPRLSDKQRVKYIESLESTATRIDTTALEILKKGMKIEGVKSQYMGASRVLAQTLRAKICPAEKDIESLHAALFHLENAVETSVGGGANFRQAQRLLKTLDKKGLDRHLNGLSAFRKRALSALPSTAIAREESIYQLKIDAEELREQMTGWVCMTEKSHDRFHIALGKGSDQKSAIVDKLDRAAVNSTISSEKDAVAKCLKNGNPRKKEGTVKVSFEITPSGKVTKARGVGAMKKTSVGRCIVKAVSRMRFPLSKAKKNMAVTFPFLVRYATDIWSGEEQTSPHAASQKHGRNFYKDAFSALTKGRNREAIRLCRQAKTPKCNRIIGLSYKNLGDTKNACKYYKLAGLDTSKLKKCE